MVQNKYDGVLSLPFELILQIFQFLDVNALEKCTLVCRQWFHATEQNEQLAWKMCYQYSFCNSFPSEYIPKESNTIHSDCVNIEQYRMSWKRISFLRNYYENQMDQIQIQLILKENLVQNYCEEADQLLHATNNLKNVLQMDTYGEKYLIFISNENLVVELMLIYDIDDGLLIWQRPVGNESSFELCVNTSCEYWSMPLLKLAKLLHIDFRFVLYPIAAMFNSVHDVFETL